MNLISDIGTLREKTDSIVVTDEHDVASDSGLNKRYPLYFSSFYKPQSSPSAAEGEDFLQQ